MGNEPGRLRHRLALALVAAVLVGVGGVVGILANAGTQTIVEEFGKVTVDYVFDPPFDGQWYLLVRNHGSTVMDLAVHFEVYGTANWAGWQ